MSDLFSEADLIDDELDEESDNYFDNLNSDNSATINRFECQMSQECCTSCSECGLFTNCSVCIHKDTYTCTFCTLNNLFR